MLLAEVMLDPPRDHDVQSWLMGQMGEFERVRHEAASASLEAKVELLSRRYAFPYMNLHSVLVQYSYVLLLVTLSRSLEEIQWNAAGVLSTMSRILDEKFKMLKTKLTSQWI